MKDFIYILRYIFMLLNVFFSIGNFGIYFQNTHNVEPLYVGIVCGLVAVWLAISLHKNGGL